jgi:hypothetical protein
VIDLQRMAVTENFLISTIRCTEASIIGPGRLHFDPNTNPANPATTPMFATNPDERC